MEIKGWPKAAVNVEPETAQDYRIILDKHVLPSLGGRMVPSITRGDVTALLRSKLAAYNRSYVGHMKRVISGVMKLVMERELISTNPAQGVGRETMRPLTAEQRKKVLAEIQRRSLREYPLFFLVAAWRPQMKEEAPIRRCKGAALVFPSRAGAYLDPSNLYK